MNNFNNKLSTCLANEGINGLVNFSKQPNHIKIISYGLSILVFILAVTCSYLYIHNFNTSFATYLIIFNLGVVLGVMFFNIMCKNWRNVIFFGGINLLFSSLLCIIKFQTLQHLLVL